MKRIYKSGSKWALWRWAESPLLYMKRLHLLHTPWGGVMLNFISRTDPWPDQHDHPANFWSFILRGGYIEYRGNKVRGYYSWRKTRYRKFTKRLWFMVNRMKADENTLHSITWTDPDTLILVFYGPRKREWGYHTPNGWVGWREYSKEIGTP